MTEHEPPYSERFDEHPERFDEYYEPRFLNDQEAREVGWIDATEAEKGEATLLFDHYDRSVAERWDKDAADRWVDINGNPVVLDDGRLLDDVVRELKEQDRKAKGPEGPTIEGLNIQY